MADTTAIYGWPYQEPTDPPDGADLGKDLAEAIEATVDSIDDRVDTAEATLVSLDTRLDTAEADLVTRPRGVIKRGRRTTATGAITTTETGVLRIDNIPVVAGRLYRISTTNINMDGSVANDIGACRIRVSTAGAATTASTQIANIRQTIDDPTNSNIVPENCFYVPGSSGTLSVLLSAVRVAGTGNVVVFCSGTDILDMVITDEGVDPGDTGVVI